MGYALEQLESTALLEIREDYPLADAYVLESIASALHAKVPTGVPERLVAAAGCELVVRPDLPVEGVLFRERIIVVRARRDRRLVVLAMLHELAHALLLRAGIGHSHGDVWCLTLALAYPLPRIHALHYEHRDTVEALRWAAPVPSWVARERLEMPTVRRE